MVDKSGKASYMHDKPFQNTGSSLPSSRPLPGASLGMNVPGAQYNAHPAPSVPLKKDYVTTYGHMLQDRQQAVKDHKEWSRIATARRAPPTRLAQ